MAKLKIKAKQRGGARPGAGRPAGPLTVPMSIRVLPETRERIIRSAAQAGVSYGGFIDYAVERVKPPQNVTEKRLKKSFDG